MTAYGRPVRFVVNWSIPSPIPSYAVAPRHCIQSTRDIFHGAYSTYLTSHTFLAHDWYPIVTMAAPRPQKPLDVLPQTVNQVVRIHTMNSPFTRQPD